MGSVSLLPWPERCSVKALLSSWTRLHQVSTSLPMPRSRPLSEKSSMIPYCSQLPTVSGPVRYPHICCSTSLTASNLVIDYDRLVVLEKGRIVESDTPYNLIQRGDGIFRSMCLKSGTFSELEATAKAKAESSL